MNRREVLSALGIGGGLAAFGETAWAQGQAKAKKAEGHAAHHDQDHGEHDDHLKTIAECARICNKTADHCLQKLREGGEDRQVHADIHQATMDCQAFCVLAASLMARKSRMATYAHQACADACRDCAAACDKGTGEIIEQCAEICRKCEEVCRAMAGDRKPGAKKPGMKPGTQRSGGQGASL